MTTGDIFWVDLPARGGHTQAGRRPAIIAQDEAVSSEIPTVLVVPLTTQLDAIRFPGTFTIETDSGNGLRRASVAIVFQLTAIDRRWLGAKIGRMGDRQLEELWKCVDLVTGREPT